MKIALCYESMIPQMGGCETYLADLARCLAADHHEVHLFTTRLDRASFPDTVVEHMLPPTSGLKFLRPWQFARSCYEAMKKEPLDVTVGFIKTWGQDILMPQGGFHVASVDHNNHKLTSPWTRRLMRFIQTVDPKQWSFRSLERRQLFAFPSLIVVPSNMVKQHAQRYYQLAESRLRVVHNAIDFSRFPTSDRLLVRSQMRDQCQLLPEDNVGLFVGHNFRLKGLDPLLRSIKLIPPEVNFKLLICGKSNKTRFVKLAERLGITDRVRFLGYHPDVREAFFAADFLVHPSFYDPCALVTMEALACGLPVITTQYNGGSELLPKDLASLTIETPHHHQAMANNIIRLCNPEERLILSRSAREAAKTWTFADHYRELLAIFEQVAAAKRPTVPIAKPGLVS